MKIIFFSVMIFASLNFYMQNICVCAQEKKSDVLQFPRIVALQKMSEKFHDEKRYPNCLPWEGVSDKSHKEIALQRKYAAQHVVILPSVVEVKDDAEQLPKEWVAWKYCPDKRKSDENSSYVSSSRRHNWIPVDQKESDAHDSDVDSIVTICDQKHNNRVVNKQWDEEYNLEDMES